MQWVEKMPPPPPPPPPHRIVQPSPVDMITFCRRFYTTKEGCSIKDCPDRHKTSREVLLELLNRGGSICVKNFSTYCGKTNQEPCKDSHRHVMADWDFTKLGNIANDGLLPIEPPPKALCINDDCEYHRRGVCRYRHEDKAIQLPSSPPWAETTTVHVSNKEADSTIKDLKNVVEDLVLSVSGAREAFHILSSNVKSLKEEQEVSSRLSRAEFTSLRELSREENNAHRENMENMCAMMVNACATRCSEMETACASRCSEMEKAFYARIAMMETAMIAKEDAHGKL